MITLSLTHLVIVGLVFLYLMFKLSEYKRRMVAPEVVHVDTSGVATNPPKFIDVLVNKTINFEVGKYSIKIEQLGIGKCMTTVNKIASLFEMLTVEIDRVPTGKVDEMKHNLMKDSIYKQIVMHIYLLSAPFVDNKRKYRKELINYSKDNHIKIFHIVEQVIDYWTYIKKLVALLSKGGSLKKTIGEWCTWNSLSMDSAGNHSIKPRFDWSMN